MVYHVDEFIIRHSSIQGHRIEIRLLYQRAMVAPRHVTGIKAAKKFTHYHITVEGSFFFTPQSENLRKNPRGARVDFTFIIVESGPNG